MDSAVAIRPCCRLRRRLGTDVPPGFMRLIALEEKSPHKWNASGVLGHPISAGDMCLIAHAYAGALEHANVIRALCFVEQLGLTFDTQAHAGMRGSEASLLKESGYGQFDYDLL